MFEILAEDAMLVKCGILPLGKGLGVRLFGWFATPSAREGDRQQKTEIYLLLVAIIYAIATKVQG